MKPQLSAFAARKQAAELEAARLSALSSESALVELQSEEQGSDALSRDESEAGEDAEVNTFAVLQRTTNGGDAVHDSRSSQVAEAEAIASFRPRLHQREDGKFILGLTAGEVVSLLSPRSVLLIH